MNKENLCLASQAVELSEHESYLEITNRICFYDSPNLNSTVLPSEGAEEKAKTLVNMPVVAKYAVNADGAPTFKGHEMTLSADGVPIFNTDTIGTHTEAYVKDDYVETVSGEYKTLPCLFGKYRIWTRNANVTAAAKRLYELGKLYSSWEIETSEYNYSDGLKKLIEYEFLGNCLLGYESAYPAYGTAANAVEMSELSNEMPPSLMIAEALVKDISINKEQEADDLKDIKTKKNSVETSDVEDIKKDENLESETVEKTKEEVVEAEETSDSSTNTSGEAVKQEDSDTESSENESTGENQIDETEVSALTQWDLRSKIEKEAEKKLDDNWCYVAYWFPTESMVWVKPDRSETELDYVLFTYSVSGDEVTLSEPQPVKLTVAFSEVNSKIAELNESLVSANETIQSLTSEVSALSVYKEKFEQAEQEKIEVEQAQKQEEMKNYILSSGLVTEEEISSNETIKDMVTNLNEIAAKALIAERFMNSMKNNKKVDKVDTSEVHEKKDNVKVHLNTEISEDVAEFKKSYFKK